LIDTGNRGEGVGMAKEKFEEALNKLEKIVSRLEKGDIPWKNL